MARRQSKPKAQSTRSASARRGWETRRANARAEARAHARRVEAGRRGYQTRQRRERREAAKARRDFLEALKREMGLPPTVLVPRRRKAAREAPPEIVAPERGPVEVRGVKVFETERELRVFSPNAESRRIAADLEDAGNYIEDIAGKAYFAILVVPDPESGRVFYQPFFIPELAPDWNPRKKKRGRKYKGGAEKRRLKAKAEQLGIGI